MDTTMLDWLQTDVAASKQQSSFVVQRLVLLYKTEQYVNTVSKTCQLWHAHATICRD